MRCEPSIGVVIATRNRRESLRSTLSHLRGLPDRPPIVVVDNGSTDGTAPAVRSEYPNVRMVASPSNPGAGARNVGARELETRYIAFADDDSWWADGAFRTAAELFRSYPRCALIAARVLLNAEQRVDLICDDMASSPIAGPVPLPGPAVLGFLGCAAIVRRDAFLEVGGFETRLGIGESIIAYHWPREAPHAASRDPTARAALFDALRGLPWVLRNRRRIPLAVEAGLARLERG